MATIRKRGSRYQVQVRRKGQRPVSKSFLARADALAWARKAEAQADRGELAAMDAGLQTVGDLLRRYETQIASKKRAYSAERYMLSLMLLHTIRKAAEAGEFDEALEALRIRRQEHARKMMDARNSCGFHPAPQPKEPQTEKMLLLPAPSEMPMEPINVGPIIQTDAR